MLFTTVALLAGAAAVRAAPTAEAANIAQLATTQRITQEPAGHIPLGPKALAAAYAKYGKLAPNHVKIAAAAATSGTVGATPLQYDEAYLSPVYIGSSSQKFLLDFDTGSSDLWVFSDKQASSQRGSHSSYHLTGTQQSGETWKISYGDGSGAQGIVYSDKVTIGGVTATSQSVEAATSVSSQFVSDASDGLLGLSFDSGNTCSPRQCNTWTTTVAPQLASNLFGVTLKKGKAGTYDFGFIDSSKYTGSITYTPVTSSLGGYYWEFKSTGYGVGSTKYSRSMTAIADTGTTLALVDDAVVSNYYAKVSGASYDSSQGGYTFPCSATLPSFTFNIGSVARTIPGSYVNYAPVDSTYCFGGLQSNSGLGFTILGDIFLKAQYVVFDKSAPRLGFAQQAGVTV